MQNDIIKEMILLQNAFYIAKAKQLFASLTVFALHTRHKYVAKLLNNNANMKQTLDRDLPK